MTGIFHFVCDFLYTAVRIWGTWQLMDVISKPKWGRKMHNNVWTAVILILSGFNAYNNSVIRALFSNGSMMLIVLLLSFLSGMTYDCKFRNAFCMIFLLWTGLALADFFFQTIACIVLTDMGSEADVFLTATVYRCVYLLLCAVFLYAAVRFVCRWAKGKGREIGRSLKWGWFLVPLLFLCMVYFQRVYKLLISEQVIHRWWLFLAGILLAISIFGGCLLIQRGKERGRMLKLRMDMMEGDYRELLKVYEEKELLLHDVKNHMLTIRRMAEAGKDQEILCYLDEMDGVLQKGRNRNLADHDLVNLILNQKFQEAENEGISLRYVMEDMSGLQLKHTEICALFSNMLDNAIEANAKIAEGMERWLELKCARKGQKLVIHISNPMAETNIQFSGELPQTTKLDKRQHGFGMRSIRHVVDMHDGYMVIEAKDGIFSLTVCVNGF